MKITENVQEGTGRAQLANQLGKGVVKGREATIHRNIQKKKWKDSYL